MSKKKLEKINYFNANKKPKKDKFDAGQALKVAGGIAALAVAVNVIDDMF